MRKKRTAGKDFVVLLFVIVLMFVFYFYDLNLMLSPPSDIVFIRAHHQQEVKVILIPMGTVARLNNSPTAPPQLLRRAAALQRQISKRFVFVLIMFTILSYHLIIFDLFKNNHFYLQPYCSF